MTSLTPPLPSAKADYLWHGYGRVHGWLDSSTSVYLSALEVLQREMPLTGDVCEIGIHHGRSFLCLALGLPASERAVAIDVFDDYESNVDGSGRGDRDIFEQHLREFGAGSKVDIIQTSSLNLEEQGFVRQGPRFRIFSIDGGHTGEITCNDLFVAQQTVLPEGLVVLDDVLNRHWLGVITGLFAYWAQGGTLVPSVLVPNKLILATSAAHAGNYQALMHKHFRAGWEKSEVPLGAHTIEVFGQHPWQVVNVSGRSMRVAKPMKQPQAQPRRRPLRRRVAARVRRLANSVPRLRRKLL